MRQRNQVPDEYTEEESKRREEEARRREEERKRYEDIDIPDDAEWTTIDVGAHHREIMEQQKKYEGKNYVSFYVSPSVSLKSTFDMKIINIQFKLCRVVPLQR